MYSNFLYDDKEAFSDLFVDVSEETPPPPIESKKETKPAFHSIKSLFSGLENSSLITALLLFYMLSDCEEDERLIILALYFLMGL